MPKLRSFDGTTLSYDVDGSGPTVVLLHGFATDAYINWVRPGIVGRLNASGYRTVALDQRGHGMSDKPHDPGAYAGDAMIRDVRVLLDELGAQRVAVVGYSMGSMHTMRLLTAGEPRVAVAVLGGVGGASVQMRGSGEAIAEAMETDDPSTISNPVAKSFREFADLTRADRRALAALQRREMEPYGDLGAITIPVLVLDGDNDPLIGDPQALADQLGSAKAEVVGGSHLNVVNNQAFQAALVAFLDEHRGAFDG